MTFIRPTSPLHTYYIVLDIRYDMSREHDTACDNGHWSLPHSSLVMGDLPRLLYPLTIFSLRQVGGREPSSQDVTLPLIPDEDREINQHLYAVWKDFVGSQSQGHSADDIKLLTEKNGRPSMYVYHTIVMVRTLPLCWQVLFQAIQAAPPPGQLPLG